MRGCLAVLVMMVLVLSAPVVSASRSDWPQLAAQNPLGSPQPHGILPARQSPKVDTQQAATRVRQVYSNHKILSVQLIEAKGPPVYRVKTLSADGVVKNVFVDGLSGEVFE
ncbi:MAG: hypothetical protein WD002_03470 [Pseudomonadales bacterium]